MGVLERFETKNRADHRLARLNSLTPVAMLEVSAVGELLWANEYWFQLTGLHDNSESPNHWFDAVHPEDRVRIIANWRANNDGASTPSIACRLVTANGNHRQMEIRVAVFPDPDRNDVTYLISAIDVTSSVRVNELARTTRELEVWAEQSAAILAEQSRDLDMFTALVACSDDAIVIVGPDGQGRYANDAFRRLFDLKDDFRWNDALRVLGIDEAVTLALSNFDEHGSWQSVVTLHRPQREPISADIRKFSLTDITSRNVGVALIVRDLTHYQALERERTRLAAEVIAAQETAIRELSTPLLPIGPGILAMPLIGAIDESRGLRILETLLAGIQQHHASVAILDLTGVRQMNDDIGDILLRSAQAARLLGSTVLLTGISPLVARTIIDLGMDLERVQIHATLEQGIRAAFAKSRIHKQNHRLDNRSSASSSR